MPWAQFFLLNTSAKIFQAMSSAWAIRVGRFFGWLMYMLDARHRDRVYQNLKIAFLPERPLSEIRQLTKQVFMNIGANFAEFLRMPCLTLDDLKAYISFDGIEHFEEALRQGKGTVLMTLHHGNWELPMLALCQFGFSESLIYKAQANASGFNRFMVSSREAAYQKFSGVQLFERGLGARKLFESLKRNEIIGMVIDQGGKEGDPVRFFGRVARFSSGGIRLALRTGAAVCIGYLRREADHVRHQLMLYPYQLVQQENDGPRDVAVNLQRVAGMFEQMIREHPAQYMWMYKIWKFDPSRNMLILDDGRTGHLRQSQAVAHAVHQEVLARGGRTQEKTVMVRYRYSWGKSVVFACATVAPMIPKCLALMILKAALTPESFDGISMMKADIVISAGSFCAPVNILAGKEHSAKTVTLLRPAALLVSRFDAMILPGHDISETFARSRRVILTKGAPNLVDENYLAEQSAGLMRRYSHLKFRARFRIGVLLGGDTKQYTLDDSVAKVLAHQIKEAAEQLDADILVTTSRRTSARVENVFIREFKKCPRCQLLIIANQDNVAEAVGGILSLADVVVVSGDSISMVSEAASSGKRTVVFPVRRRLGSGEDYKHNRFIDLLNKKGYILSSDPKMIRQSIFDLAKNKILTRKLDDASAIRQGISRLL